MNCPKYRDCILVWSVVWSGLCMHRLGFGERNKTATKLPFHANMPVTHGQQSFANHFISKAMTVPLLCPVNIYVLRSHFIIVTFC